MSAEQNSFQGTSSAAKEGSIEDEHLSHNEHSFEEDANQTKSKELHTISPPTVPTLPYHDNLMHAASDAQKTSKANIFWSSNSPNLNTLDDGQYKMSETLSNQNLILDGYSKKGWSSMSSLEKSLSVALGIASVLCLALMIAVIIVGIKLNEDDYTPSPRPTTTTELPPWITTIKTTTETGCGTTPRPRPTTTRPPDSGKVSSENICLTSNCVKTAGKILSNLNTDINPCDDFYQFACGGWMEQNSIPESEPHWGQFEILKQKLTRKVRSILESEKVEEDPEPLKLAQDFFDACMDQGDDDETSLLAETVYEMFMENDNSTTNATNSTQLSLILGKIRRVLGGNYIFSMHVSLDDEDTSNYTIYLDQPIFGLSRKYLLGNESSDEIEAYSTLIKSIWTVFNPDDDNDTIAESIIAFETMLANISTPAEDRRDKMEMYNPMSIDDLSSLTENTTIEWVDYFQEVFQDVIKSNLSFSIENSTKVVVHDLMYFQQIATIFNGTDNETLNMYLQWRILLDFANEAWSTFREYSFQYDKKTIGITRAALRWEECVNEANSFLGMAISYRYVKDNIQGGNYTDFISTVDEIVENIRASFIDNLDDIDWIADNETRNSAKIKAESMRSLVGFPEWLLEQGNETALDEYYQGLSLINASSHLQNYLDIVKWSSWNSLKRITETKDENRWVMSPTTVNAAYAPQYNSINLPLGILQTPFYTDFDDEVSAINYGAIGAIIGHEIIHGFDDKGRQNDENGNLRDWWDPKTLKNYIERDICFQKQYASYGMEKLGHVKVNGVTTLGENIADNGGVREAYNAYQRYVAQNGEDKALPGINYSPDQLFFLSFAQSFCTSYTPEALKEMLTTGTHSPSQFRVKGVIENSDEFSYVWFCPRPEKASVCKIW